MHEAYVAQALLESEDVYAVVPDECLINLNWLYRNVLGGIKLQVPEADARLATDLLDAHVLEDEGLTSEPCLLCGGPAVEHFLLGQRIAFLIWMILGFPFFVIRSRDEIEFLIWIEFL